MVCARRRAVIAADANIVSLEGLEPPIFWFVVRRLVQLGHRDWVMWRTYQYRDLREIFNHLREQRGFLMKFSSLFTIPTRIEIPGEFFHDISDHNPFFLHRYFDLFWINSTSFHLFLHFVTNHINDQNQKRLTLRIYLIFVTISRKLKPPKYLTINESQLTIKHHL